MYLSLTASRMGVATAAVLAVAAGTAAAADTANAQVVDTSDKSGTNPLNFQRTFQFDNEFDWLSSAARVNYTRFRYTEPLANNFSLRLEVPVVYGHAAIAGSSALGDDAPEPAPPSESRHIHQTGLGDMVLRADYIPYISRSGGLKIGAELGAPTASSAPLGSGKWTISPNVSYAMFLPGAQIVAPSYKQAFDFAGDTRRGINQGTLDIYYVIRFDEGHQWVTFDPAYTPDYGKGKYAGGVLKVNYGHMLGTLFGSNLSGFIKPGMGIGHDKPYPWSIEFGVTLVGF